MPSRSSEDRPRHRRLLAAALLLTWLVGPVAAQDAAEPAWDPETWLRPDEPFAIRVSAVSGTAAGDRLAIFVGDTDRTDFFRRDGELWTHRSEVAPLPRGETQVVVWRVDPEVGWQELARWPLRVLLRGGLERRESALRLDLEATGDVDSGGDPEAPFAQDGRGSGQLAATFGVTRGGWNVDAAANVVGVSNLQEALRFASEGDDAPQVDLSSYRVEVSRPVGGGSFHAAVGHVDFGDSRQLIAGFASRGVTVSSPLGSAVDVGLMAQNGTAIVGWDNALGLDDGSHRVYAGRVGVELLAERPGGLRLEATGLDGSLRPEADFNQGLVSDAEESSGWSLRLRASTPGDRVRVDGAFATSRFDNPFDPLLAQGEDLVAVQQEERSARYLDLDLALVSGRAFGDGQLFDLRLALRHEMVEPQYRSVGAFAGADVERYGADINSTIGPLAALLSWSRSEDNLDDIESILTTRTEQASGNVSVALADLFGAEDGSGRGAWPTLSWTTQRIHQRGLGIPVDGGFNASHVPDQISWSHDGGLDWGGGGWTLGLRFSGSLQDNRQPGREDADFTTEVYSLSASFTVHPRLDLGVELSSERAESQAAGEVTETENRGASFFWRPHDRVQVNGTVALTESDSDPPSFATDNVVGDLNASWRFDRSSGQDSNHGIDGQLYLRYAYERAESFDPFFGADDFRRTWRLSTGINLSFF